MQRRNVDGPVALPRVKATPWPVRGSEFCFRVKAEVVRPSNKPMPRDTARAMLPENVNSVLAANSAFQPRRHGSLLRVRMARFRDTYSHGALAGRGNRDPADSSRKRRK